MGRHHQRHPTADHTNGSAASGAPIVDDAISGDADIHAGASSAADGSSADGSMTGPDGGFSEPGQRGEFAEGPTDGPDDGPDFGAVAAQANSRATAFIAAHPIVTIFGAVTAGFVIGRLLSRA